MSQKLQQHNGYIADYYRKSSPNEDRQALSHETQKRMADVTWSALPDDFQLRRRQEFEPESATAFKLNKQRPVYQEMMSEAMTGKIFAVRAFNFSRMMRTPKETGEFVQLMQDGLVRFFVATSTGRIYRHDSSDDISDLMREGGANTKYSMDLGRSVKAGMETKARKGGHASGPVEFGFKPHRYFDDQGILQREVVPDEKRYHLIKALFVAAASGLSLSELVLWAKEKGYTLRATPKRPERFLSKTAIAGILHNPFYKGFRHFDGIITKWTDDPPAPIQLWERVQVVMSLNCTCGSRKKSPELRQNFIFDRCVFCSICGGHMSAYQRKIKSNGKVFVYYECKRRQESGKTGCGTCMRQDRLLAQYQAVLMRVVLPEEKLIVLREKLLEIHEEKMRARSEELTSLTKQYKELELALTEQVKALPKAITLGVSELTEAEISRLKAERQKIKMQLDAGHKDTTAWIEKAIRCFELVGLAQEAILYGSPQIRASVLNAISSKLSVDGEKLICQLRSPFEQVAKDDVRCLWWAILDSNQ